jgi:hypothetical protein
MSSWAPKELRAKVEGYRVHKKKQIGMILTHDKNDDLIDFKFRYEVK